MNAPAHPTRAAAKASKQLGQIAAMQAIEGNPLTPDEITMFEMFDLEGWSDEQQMAHITAKFADAQRYLGE